MAKQLKEKLHQYIVDHNPDLLLQLQQSHVISRYIDDKLESVKQRMIDWSASGMQSDEVDEAALKAMTEELRPSRYLYLKAVLEEEFEKDYLRFVEIGVLTYELVNMIDACASTFETFGFSEANEVDRFLRYAIIEKVHNYLN